MHSLQIILRETPSLFVLQGPRPPAPIRGDVIVSAINDVVRTRNTLALCIASRCVDFDLSISRLCSVRHISLAKWFCLGDNEGRKCAWSLVIFYFVGLFHTPTAFALQKATGYPPSRPSVNYDLLCPITLSELGAPFFCYTVPCPLSPHACRKTACCPRGNIPPC